MVVMEYSIILYIDLVIDELFCLSKQFVIYLGFVRNFI